MISCDSAGGVGSKPLDRVRVTPCTVGKFTARVALMEAIAVGAEPVCVTATLSVEPRPTGNEIIRGIRWEMKSAQLKPQTKLISSTEKNFPVEQTGVGVTVLGLVHIRALRVGSSKRGDDVFAIGTPTSGVGVMAAARNGLIADTRDVRRLIRLAYVREIVPCGSKGILHEARVLAKDSKLQFRRSDVIGLNLMKSCGPATVFVCVCAAGRFAKVRSRVTKPVARIGALA